MTRTPKAAPPKAPAKKPTTIVAKPPPATPKASKAKTSVVVAPVKEPKATKAKEPKPELPTVFFEDARSFDQWLAKNHGGPGLWVRFAKKASGIKTLTYAEAVDLALVWGFIDGQSKGGDPVYFLQRFTPRGPKSIWSKINREKIAALEAAGKMQPPGIAEVVRAKADGRWDAAYDPPSRATVPDDLAAALAASPRAAAAFTTLDATNRYAILHRLQTAKKPETRQRNLEKFVQMLAEGRLLHPR